MFIANTDTDYQINASHMLTENTHVFLQVKKPPKLDFFRLSTSSCLEKQHIRYNCLL